MKRIDQLQEQTKAREQAYAWGKIAVVFSALIGWLLLATVIGVNDPSGSLWWLQIIIFITAVIAVVKLPMKQANQQFSIHYQNYPASYANMQ